MLSVAHTFTITILLFSNAPTSNGKNENDTEFAKPTQDPSIEQLSVKAMAQFQASIRRLQGIATEDYQQANRESYQEIKYEQHIKQPQYDNHSSTAIRLENKLLTGVKQDQQLVELDEPHSARFPNNEKMIFQEVEENQQVKPKDKQANNEEKGYGLKSNKKLAIQRGGNQVVTQEDKVYNEYHEAEHDKNSSNKTSEDQKRGLENQLSINKVDNHEKVELIEQPLQTKIRRNHEKETGNPFSINVKEGQETKVGNPLLTILQGNPKVKQPTNLRLEHITDQIPTRTSTNRTRSISEEIQRTELQDEVSSDTKKISVTCYQDQFSTNVQKNQDTELNNQFKTNFQESVKQLSAKEKTNPKVQLRNHTQVEMRENLELDPLSDLPVPYSKVGTRDLKSICDFLSKSKSFFSTSLRKLTTRYGKQSTLRPGKKLFSGGKTSPPREESSLIRENISPTREGTSFSREKTSPTQERTSSFREKTSPSRERTTSFREKTSPTREGSSSFREKTSPSQEATSSYQEKTSPFEKKTPSFKGKYTSYQGETSSGSSEDSPPCRPKSILRRQKSPTYQNSEGFSLADSITHINMIPGSGEYVYDTIIQKYKKITNGPATSINNYSRTKKSDAMVSLDQLKKDLPNIEWVSVVVNWFAKELNIKDCKIYPAVEFQNGSVIVSEDWQVGHIKRDSARMISRDIRGNQRHRGTVSDGALIRFINELHRRGYKVMLHPMILFDTEEKEWRGKLTGSALFVDTFFHNEYNFFIKHYAYIAKHTNVEGFVIGSELEGLTTIKDWEGNHPVVSELVNLARYVKNELGRGVTVTYAANWSEYHSKVGWYFLDELWSSQYIDVVGINAYFPLTDGPEPYGGYSVQDIITGWSSGEGYNYYLDDPSKSRPEKMRYTESRWAWKNIEKWWSEVHVNPDGKNTNWQPKMKKIWFIEYGFASVDACTNEPYMFIDLTNKETKYPRYSNKAKSFRSQRIAIEGTIKKWQNSDMVEKMFLWAWDARPFPYFPNLREVWDDAINWPTSHSIQGKISGALESNQSAVAMESNVAVTWKGKRSDSP